MWIPRLKDQVFKFIDINKWFTNKLDKDSDRYRLSYIY